MSDPKKHVLIDYTNHAGVRSVREIVPDADQPLTFGNTEWHPESQWLLHAHDVKKDDMRTFAMAGIHRWGVQPDRQMEIDLSISAQLQRSMEANARMKERLRTFMATCPGLSVDAGRAVTDILADKQPEWSWPTAQGGK